jgi:hypothetical protein
MAANWKCMDCDTFNAPTASKCMVCGGTERVAAAADDTATGPTASAAGRPGSRIPGSPVVGASRPSKASGGAMWTCAKCETHNSADATACIACEGSRESSAAPKPPRETPIRAPRVKKDSGTVPRAEKAPSAPASTGTTGPTGGATADARSFAGTFGVPGPLLDSDWRTTATGIRRDPAPDPSATSSFGPTSGFSRPAPAPAPVRSDPAPPTAPVPPPPVRLPRPRPTPTSSTRKARTGTPPVSTARPPAAPTRPGPAVYRPVKRRRKRVLRVLILIGILYGIYDSRQSLLGALQHFEQSQQSQPVSQAPNSVAQPVVEAHPCPDGVASTLPSGDRASSTLVETHKTSGYTVTICADSSGALYYHGVSRTNSSLWITLPVKRSGSDYIATNKGYEYELSPRHLVVSKGGHVEVDQTFTS